VDSSASSEIHNGEVAVLFDPGLAQTAVNERVEWRLWADSVEKLGFWFG
jgi:hypothetical protein